MKTLKMLAMAALTIVSMSVFAQDSTEQKMKSKGQKTEMIKYSCPMHSEVTSDKPGKCSKCGMDLTISKKEETKKYVCPMHPDVISDKPGKCSKCGMDLNKVKEKEKTAASYTCPMHPDVTSDKPGSCSKCGMALKETKKDDHSDHQH
ncbi:MAG: heavy metal-binding domain-containing protein [Chitinophagaceae bacterium]